MPSPPSTRLLSTVVSPNGTHYQITQNDLMYLAKMVKYEGGFEDGPALLWTLAQRLALVDRSKFPTLASLAQAYSQPINPIWRRNGSKCRLGGPFHDAPDCSPARLDRRDRAAKETWGSLEPQVTDLVTLWATGRVTNPVPTAVHWGAGRPVGDRPLSQAEYFLRDNPDAKAVLSYGGNVFIAERKTKDWPDDHVGLENRDGSITTTVVTKAPFLMSVARGIAQGFRVV